MANLKLKYFYFSLIFFWSISNLIINGFILKRHGILSFFASPLYIYTENWVKAQWFGNLLEKWNGLLLIMIPDPWRPLLGITCSISVHPVFPDGIHQIHTLDSLFQSQVFGSRKAGGGRFLIPCTSSLSISFHGLSANLNMLRKQKEGSGEFWDREKRITNTGKWALN